MRPSLFVPLGMVAVLAAGLYAPYQWVFVAVVCFVSIFLTVLVEAAHEPEIGATSEHAFSTAQLYKLIQTAPLVDYPLYLAGVGHGICPATDWYTARLDGQTVLVLEAIPVPAETMEVMEGPLD